jgi:hypothetical protein
MPPAQHMHMQVIHCLACIPAAVDHQPVAVLKSLRARDLGGCQQQTAQNLGVLAARMGNRWNVLERHHQKVHRRLRIDIGERIRALVAMHRFGRNRSFDDFAEQAIHRDQCTGARASRDRAQLVPRALSLCESLLMMRCRRDLTPAHYLKRGACRTQGRQIFYHFRFNEEWDLVT